MTDDAFGPKEMLTLRRLTRAITDPLREQASQYVAALTPLLRPKSVLGEYADGAARDPVPVHERTMKELQSMYEQVATAAPFNLLKDLKPPVELLASAIEVSPLEYTHVARVGSSVKTIKVTAPLTWVLSYQGFEAGRLNTIGFLPRRLLGHVTGGSRSTDELRKFVLHYLVMHLSATKQPGVQQVLRDLRFPLATVRVDDFGPLPLTCVTAAVSTVRPPDDVLIEHTEVAGTDAFEEVVNLRDVTNLADPLKVRLTHLARAGGVELPAA